MRMIAGCAAAVRHSDRRSFSREATWADRADVDVSCADDRCGVRACDVVANLVGWEVKAGASWSSGDGAGHCGSVRAGWAV